MKRIFLAFFQSKVKHSIPAYDFWIFYLKNGLKESGYKVLEADVDWAFGLVPKADEEQTLWKIKTWEKTLKFCKEEKPDIFLSYLYPEQVDVDSVDALKKMGIPCVNFFCDNVRNYQKIPSEYNCFDLHWVPEYQALKMYTSVGLKVIHAPMPMWVEPQYRNYISAKEELDQVSFIGSKDILRARFLHQAIEKGISLRIMGAGWLDIGTPINPEHSVAQTSKLFNQWQQIHAEGIIPWLRKFNNRYFYPMPSPDFFENYIDPQPSFSRYVDLTRRSKVVLGINRYPSNMFSQGRPNTYSRLRDIEAPMLGACYLTEYTEGLEYLYDLGTEIETYRTVEELKEKIERLSGDSELREKLRKKGQQRALSQHSISQTIRKIMGSL